MEHGAPPAQAETANREVRSILGELCDGLAAAADCSNALLVLMRWNAWFPDDLQVLTRMQDLRKTVQDLFVESAADPTKFLERARDLAGRGQKEKAFADVQRSLALDPGDAAAQALLREIAPDQPIVNEAGSPARLIRPPKVVGAPRRIQFASYYNSGRTWFQTVLSDLDLYVTSTNEGHWVDWRDGSVRLRREHLFARMGSLIPAITNLPMGKPFPGSHSLSLEAGHYWPAPLFSTTDTILIYRNVLSVFWSLYRRRVEESKTHGLAFSEYFARHSGSTLQLSEPDDWALFHLAWLNLFRGERLLLVSFDRAKKNPIEEVGAILGFLGVDRPDREITRAVESARADTLRRANPVTARDVQVRSGDPDEYLSVLSRSDQEGFTGLPKMMSDFLDGTELDGTGDVMVSAKPFAEIFGELENFAGALPADLLEMCEEGSFATAKHTAKGVAEGSDAAAIFLLAVAFAGRLLGNPINPQDDTLTAPLYPVALKTFLFGLCHPMTPHRVFNAARKEALR